MALETCSVKKLLLLIIFIGGLTLLIFIKIISSTVSSGISITVAPSSSFSTKSYPKNSTSECWLKEDSIILEKCHRCLGKQECVNSSFVEIINCKYSGITYKSCNSSDLDTSESDFWIFQSTQFFFALLSLCVIRYKKKQFHKKLMKKLQKHLDSVV